MFPNRIVQKGNNLPVAGQRINTPLDNGVRTMLVRLNVTGQLDVTVAGTAVLNRGSVLAALDYVGINMDGEDRIILDTRTARVIQELLTGREYTALRAAGFGVQAATLLQDTVWLFAAMPGIARPEETSLLERNTGIPVNLFTQANPIPVGRIVKGGTATLTNLKATVEHLYDQQRGELPLLRPYIHEIVTNVPAANNALEIPLRPTKYLAAIIVQQDSDDGEVSDIINALSLIGDGGQGIIPFPTTYSDLVAHGAISDDFVSAEGAGYMVLNFMADGRLSRLVNPFAYSNLRFLINASVSAKANGRIRVTMIEMERDATLTAPDPLPFSI
jgi:hypothetical protein